MTAIADLPDIRPSLLLDFANSGRVDPRIECTRASSATCWGPDGKLRTVPANVPRIDYDPATGKCLGLLVEPGSTNFLRWSSDLTNAVWANTAATPQANAGQAPDGTYTASKLIPTTANAGHFNSQVVSRTFTVGEKISFYCFAKAAGYNFLRLYASPDTFNSAARSAGFDLVNGVATHVPSGVEAKITKLTDGWCLCLIVLTVETATTAATFGVNSQNVASAVTVHFEGDGVSGALIWGAQVEARSVPTSYIPTTSSTVARATDVVKITGNSFLSWCSPDEGTFVVNASVPYFSKSLISEHTTFSVNNGTSNAYMRTRAYSTGGSLFWDATARLGETTLFDLHQRNVSVENQSVKSTLAYKASEASNASDGVFVGSAAVTTLPTFTQMTIGGAPNGGSHPFHMQRIAYYHKYLTPEQQQSITA